VVKLPDSSPKFDLKYAFSSSLALTSFSILILWLVCGIVALFLGWIGGEWGWGFGFGWYLPLLAAVVVVMAGIGIFASVRIFTHR